MHTMVYSLQLLLLNVVPSNLDIDDGGGGREDNGIPPESWVIPVIVIIAIVAVIATINVCIIIIKFSCYKKLRNHTGTFPGYDKTH